MSETTEQATFTGEILTDHGPVEALLAIESGRVNLTTTNDFIGSWAVDHCRITPVDGGQFLIEAEGDSVMFISSDPARLKVRVEQMWEAVPPPPSEPDLEAEVAKPPPSIIEQRTTSNVAGGSVVGSNKWSISKKVAEAESDASPEPIELPIQPVTPVPAPIPRGHKARSKRLSARTRTVRRRRSRRLTSGGWLKAKKGVNEETRQSMTIAAAVITVALLVGGTVWSISLLSGQGRVVRASEQRASVPTLPPLTVTTLAGEGDNVPTTTVRQLALVDSTPRQFAERWNSLLLPVDEQLLMPLDLGGLWSVSPTPYITISGVSDPITGLMTSVIMTAVPQSEPEADRRILVGLGAMIGASEPQLTGPGRRALLEVLGLDVNRPNLAGLNDARTYGDQLYQLSFDQEAGVLRFTVSLYQPEQSPPAEE